MIAAANDDRFDFSDTAGSKAAGDVGFDSNLDGHWLLMGCWLVGLVGFG